MQQTSATRRSLWIAVALGWPTGALLMAQTEAVVDVTDCRPLAVAVEQAETVLGIPINYEDVRYENSADLEDVSTAAQRAEVPGYRLLVPRTGRVSGLLRAGRFGPHGGKVLDVANLLSSYRENGLPGDFTIEEANGMLYVVPTRYLAADGRKRDMLSLMRTPVSVPFADRTVWDTVAVIMDSVSVTTRARVRIGMMPFFPKLKISYGVSGASARDALAELFGKAASGPVSYQLLFDPRAGYMLNVHPVPSAGPDSAATLPGTEKSSSSGHFFDKK